MVVKAEDLTSKVRKKRKIEIALSANGISEMIITSYYLHIGRCFDRHCSAFKRSVPAQSHIFKNQWSNTNHVETT